MPIPAETLERIKKNDPTLTALNLTNLTDDDVTTLCGALRNNTYIQSLFLFPSKISAAGAATLAENTTLTTLIINDNNIGNAGAVALAKNTTLKRLCLSKCGIGSEGAIELAKNTILTELGLRLNHIGAAGAEALARNTTLKTLNVDGNNLGDTGAKALLDNETLLDLTVPRLDKALNNVKAANDPEQLDAIIRELKALNEEKELNTLNFYLDQPSCQKKAQNLQQALAFCEILKPLKDIKLLGLRQYATCTESLSDLPKEPECSRIALFIDVINEIAKHNYRAVVFFAYQQLKEIKDNPEHFAHQYVEQAMDELKQDVQVLNAVENTKCIPSLNFSQVLDELVPTRRPLINGKKLVKVAEASWLQPSVNQESEVFEPARPSTSTP